MSVPANHHLIISITKRFRGGSLKSHFSIQTYKCCLTSSLKCLYMLYTDSSLIIFIRILTKEVQIFMYVPRVVKSSQSNYTLFCHFQILTIVLNI